MCIICKALCPYVSDARLGLWVSLEHALLVPLQPTKLSDAQVLPTSWLDGSTRGLQPCGHVHKEAVHLLSLQEGNENVALKGNGRPWNQDRI